VSWLAKRPVRGQREEAKMELQEVHELLIRYIRPQSNPVAVRLLSSLDEIPKRTKMPLRDMKRHVTVCQVLAMSRRYGWIMAIGEEDQACPWGSLTLGFVPAKAGLLDGSFDESRGYMKRELAVADYQSIPRLEYGKYRYMLVSPINKAEFEPHLILVWGNPAQVARLIQGRVNETRGFIRSLGSVGIACARMITGPLLEDECTFVVAGGGDRYFGLTQDHEMIFAMPWSKVEMTVKGLKETHDTLGWRYPTPSYLSFEVQFPQRYREALAYLREKENE
jgi:uncharacterized protein (DUF169 family)